MTGDGDASFHRIADSERVWATARRHEGRWYLKVLSPSSLPIKWPSSYSIRSTIFAIPGRNRRQCVAISTGPVIRSRAQVPNSILTTPPGPCRRQRSLFRRGRDRCKLDCAVRRSLPLQPSGSEFPCAPAGAQKAEQVGVNVVPMRNLGNARLARKALLDHPQLLGRCPAVAALAHPLIS